MSPSRSTATLTVCKLKVLNMMDREEPELLAEVDSMRPKTRADCIAGPRPCIFVSCKHNLYLDVSDIGSIKFNFPDKELDELEETCALDVADRGGITLESVGSLMSLTRERVRQIEVMTSAKLRDEFEPESLEPVPHTKHPKTISQVRRDQLRAAKKKYRQGNGRKMTNAAQARYHAKKRAE